MKDQESILIPCEQRTHASGWTSRFSLLFVEDEGVISLSLKDLTLICSVSINVTLISMLYVSCSYGTEKFECNVERFPFVSDVIAQETYDRIFLFITTVFVFGVH